MLVELTLTMALIRGLFNLNLISALRTNPELGQDTTATV